VTALETLTEIAKQVTRDQLQEAILDLPPEYQLALATEYARQNFSEFVRQAWHLSGTAEKLQWGWHLEALCDHLQAVADGHIRRLLINIAPGMAKSKLCAVLWPAWVWARQPQTQFLCATHTYSLAERDSGYCRQLIESPWYRYRFMHEWAIKTDQNAKHFWANTKEGHRLASGIGGTGLRADAIVLDDPLQAVDAYSDAARNHAERWIGHTLTTRFNDQATGRIVAIMQRLHHRDPSAFLLAGGGYEHLMLPSEFESSRRCITFGKFDGERREFWRDPREQDGEVLFEAKFPKEVLEAAKAPNALGADGFAAQHQQRPSAEGGGMFKVQAWRFWRYSEQADSSKQRPIVDGVPCWDGPANTCNVDDLDEVLISVDATFRKTVKGSFVAIHVWGKTGSRRLLLDRVHARMDFTETVKALLSVISRWPQARKKLIEGKANGDAIISTLTAEHAITGIIPVNPGDASKEQRAHAMQPYQAAGNVELPDGAPWLGEYIGEHAAFPAGYNDDVDAQSQALQGFEAETTTMDMWGEADLGE
jgi:predicted phage terminase large subunit-like protein